MHHTPNFASSASNLPLEVFSPFNMVLQNLSSSGYLGLDLGQVRHLQIPYMKYFCHKLNSIKFNSYILVISFVSIVPTWDLHSNHQHISHIDPRPCYLYRNTLLLLCYTRPLWRHHDHYNHTQHNLRNQNATSSRQECKDHSEMVLHVIPSFS